MALGDVRMTNISAQSRKLGHAYLMGQLEGDMSNKTRKKVKE